MKDGTDRGLVQSVLRAVRLLDIISRNLQISLSELTRKSGLKKTTVSRICSTLKAAGIIDQSPQDKRYFLTIWSVEMGSRVLNSLDVRRLGRPIIEEFVAKEGVSILVAVLDRGDVIYVDKLTASEAFRITMTVGERAPAYCSASGKAMLGFLDPALCHEILLESSLKPITDYTITDIKTMEDDLAKTRERGYALDREERIKGVWSVAAPILGPNGKVMASIAVPRMKVAMTHADMDRLGHKVALLAKKVSELSGWGMGLTHSLL